MILQPAEKLEASEIIYEELNPFFHQKASGDNV